MKTQSSSKRRLVRVDSQGMECGGGSVPLVGRPPWRAEEAGRYLHQPADTDILTAGSTRPDWGASAPGTTEHSRQVK